ncbi:MAG TPA: ferredoxin [Thermomonospora sp.]|nr:ferredoxin [Thermomonospora sp.]
MSVDTTRWLVEVNRRTCIGSGVCASAVPGHFTVVNGKSQPVEERVEPDEEVLDIADMCPMGAIRVVDEASGKVLVPEDDA